MTPEQALAILDSVTAGIQLNRKDHTMVVLALQKLQSIVHPTPTPPPKKSFLAEAGPKEATKDTGKTGKTIDEMNSDRL